MNTRAVALVFVSVGAALWLAPAARADSLAFTIYKEADPIGHDVYSIDKNGDATTVKVKTQTDVKVLFIEYHYRHERTEVWKGGLLDSLLSDTDDDGTKHHIDLYRNDGALAGSADGAQKTIPGDTVPFTLWTNAFLKHTALLDVTDFAQMKVAVEDKGADQVKVGDQSVATHHYLLTGDLKWDLWYSADGMLLKTAFKRRGYPIFMVRE